MIEMRHKVCARECDKIDDLLNDLHLSRMDKLADATAPNFMLADVEQQFNDLKHKINQLKKVQLQYVRYFIEISSLQSFQANEFLQDWSRMKRNEIILSLSKTQLQLEHAKYSDVDELLDVFSRWKTSLASS